MYRMSFRTRFGYIGFMSSEVGRGYSFFPVLSKTMFT